MKKSSEISIPTDIFHLLPLKFHSPVTFAEDDYQSWRKNLWVNYYKGALWKTQSWWELFDGLYDD